MQSQILHEADDYVATRDMDIIGNAQITVAKYISLRSGKSYDQAFAWAKQRITAERLKNPQLMALVREARGDRHKAKLPFLDYIKRIGDTGRILCPNMVCYSNPNDEVSYLSDFIDYNMDRRSKIKKEGQLAGMNGDKEYEAYCDREQGNTKFFNNSVSGAQCSPYNALVNPSAHTSLTSTCRSVTSYANSLIEKFLGGMRHYYTPEIVKADIAFISTRIDVVAIQSCRNKFGIAPITVDYVMSQIKRSTEKYWSSPADMKEIHGMLMNLSENELIGFSLTGDWRSMIDTQDHVIRAMYDRMMDRPTTPHPNPDEAAANVDDDVKAMVGLLASDYLAGLTPAKLKKKDPQQFAIYASLIDHAKAILAEYSELFRVFVAFKYLTTGIHSYPLANRKVVIASDTDSAIFSTQDFVKWYNGQNGFQLEHNSVAAITAYITSQLIAHALAVLSAQMGVSKELLFRLTMKMEFSIPVMATVATKTYMMVVAAKEGNVFPEPDLDIKGVLLKSSKVPRMIANVRDQYYESLLLKVYNGDKFTPKEIVAPIAKTEHIILNNINAGNVFFYRGSRINDAIAYKNPMQSDYKYYELWNEVFARKYGSIDQLPIQGIKVNVDLPNLNAIHNWIENVLPLELQEPMRIWVRTYNVKYFTQFVVPGDLLPEGKLPVEFRPIVDRGRLISDVLGGMYLAASGFGVHILDKHTSAFASDLITEQEAEQLSFINVQELMDK